MTRIIDGVMLLLSSSLAVSILSKATLIAALGLIGAWLARGRRAAARHAVLAAAFAALLALPVACLLAPRVSIAVTGESNVPALFSEAMDLTEPYVAANGRVGVAAVIGQSPDPSLSALLLAGWLTGVTLFGVRMIVGLWQVYSMRRVGLPWRHGSLLVKRLALDAGIERRVDVLLHESLPAPVTCGIVHPAIALPPDAQNWNGEDLNRAVIHELEHVRRYDWITHCLAQMVCALYWFHPVVWIARHRLTLEAERACDDAVLRRSEATAYADQLVGLARRLSAVPKSPALAMANRSDLSARVRSLLDGGQQRGRAGAFLVAIACATAATLVCTISPLRLVAATKSATQTASAPAFDVASVKPWDPQGTLGIGGLHTYPGGRVVAFGCTMSNLIEMAFDTELFQFPGKPGWVDDHGIRFNIEAKPPASSVSSRANPPYPKAPPNDEQRQMLLTLLVERFGLKFHRETKEGAVYLLEKGNGKLKLQAPKDENVFPWAGTVNGGPPFASGMAGINISMAQLAKRLTPVVGRPVLDKTGLNGSFDFKTENAQTEYAPFDPNLDRVASVLTSLRELGLKLEPSKAQVETIVIDHAEKPSLN